MKVLFLNQYGPPDSPPTAKLLGDMADYLKTRGHTVEIVTAARKYEEREHGDRARGASELRALLRILRRGLFSPRPDVVVSFSSPPCLVFAATLIARRHLARSIHWALDLYPDLAISLGVLPEGPIARLLRRIVGWSYRQTDKIITLDADMQAYLRQQYEVEAEILAPWPPEIGSTAAKPDDPWSWLYSGNLGRAHEWKILLETQREVEKRGLPIRLIIQGGGQAWPEAQRYANELGLRNCFWRDYAEEKNLVSTLAAAGALVITQRPETRGMLWPSKLALCLLTGKPILWVGPTDGATARTLKKVAKPIHGVFSTENPTLIADWLEKSSRQTTVSEIEPKSIARLRTESLEQWLKQI